jgi:galactose mutarotase-like enzyme
MEHQDSNPSLPIETIKIGDGNEISFCPLRGGSITSIKCKGTEILYLDEATLNNPETHIRGGIPILFPNAGPIESSLYPHLQQHGFARDSSHWKVVKSDTGFIETLIADGETMGVYPYDFSLSVSVEFTADGSFVLEQKIENRDTEKILPVAAGLHPYFKVPHDKKDEIVWNFEGGNYIQDNIEMWANGIYVSVDNPKVKDPQAVLEVIIPYLGTLSMDVSSEYKKIWVWSMPGKDFVCIEPVMRDKGGLVEDPEIINPQSSSTARVCLRVEE